MSQIPSSLFKQSLVAVAVVALSGCATTGQDGSLAGDLGHGVVTAGQKTMGFGTMVMHRTGYLLGLNDDPGVPVANAAGGARADAVGNAPRGVATAAAVPVAKLPLHLDEVDLAMMEEDALMPGAAGRGTVVDDAVLLAATAGDVFDVVPFEDAAAVAVLPGTVRGTVPASVPAEPAPVAVVAARDLERRVGERETLWDIAKETTGDATNWHVLADVNDLGPGASVFPGQTLTIPADMLRPELAAASPAATVVAPVPTASTGSAVPVATPGSAPVAVAVAPRERLAVPDAVSPVAPAATGPSDAAESFSIAAGETLWDFSKRTTGDATNWQAIAVRNGFDERAATSVRAGQTIYVPHTLVEERGASTVAVATGAGAVATPAPAAPVAAPAAVPAAVAAVAAVPAAEPAAEPARVASNGAALEPIPQVGDSRTVGETIDASAAVLARNNGVDAPADDTVGGDDRGRDIRIVEAAYTGGTDAGVPAAGGAPKSILISGTYYPKAVYSAADFSAGLLMRVSPGTRLDVSSVEGQWFRVETDRGTGWVNRRDTK